MCACACVCVCVCVFGKMKRECDFDFCAWVVVSHVFFTVNHKLLEKLKQKRRKKKEARGLINASNSFSGTIGSRPVRTKHIWRKVGLVIVVADM